MIKYMLPVLALGMISAGHVFADDSENSSSIKIEDAKPEIEKNKPSSGEDVDEIITNKQLRAQSGSKSKWSIGSQIIYKGSSLETPFDADRPNISGSAGTTTVSNLGGYLGVAYKMTTTDRLALNFGVRWLAPFGPLKSGVKRTDIYDPQLQYSKAYKWAGIQSVFAAGPTLFTRSDLVDYGYAGGFTVQQNSAYEFGSSGLSLGVGLLADWAAFNKFDQASLENSADYDLMVSPFLEYVLNDRFNFRTVFNYASFEHVRAMGPGRLHKYANVQSVGVGISITRDIFLYPNLQFASADITHMFRSDQTNVALQANINVF